MPWLHSVGRGYCPGSARPRTRLKSKPSEGGPFRPMFMKLGFVSYCGRFVQGFATIAAPLSRLAVETWKIRWTAECQSAFDELKRHLTSVTFLVYPQPMVYPSSIAMPARTVLERSYPLAQLVWHSGSA